jgi:tRNA pseudouridine13 synthase
LLVSKLEKSIGIEAYSTHSLGTQGIIRQSADDFAVEEVLVDGSKAVIRTAESSVGHEVLGSSPVRKRYLLAVLVKRNWDMFLALSSVARQLGIGISRMHVAGIKDANALTAQYVTIEGVSAEDVEKVHVKDIELRPVGYLYHRLSSYYLLGNNFDISIKEIDKTESAVRRRVMKTIEALESSGGVPNFFGHQRFGTTRPITHLVGKAIVQGDLKKAVMVFLARPDPHEHPASKEAREQLQIARDFRQAFKSFPKQLRYERLMIRHLVKNPEDFSGAFKTLPIKLRMLFTQAYQSYLFNKFLSKRIERQFQLDKAEVGDYVTSVERSGLPARTLYRRVAPAARRDVNRLLEAGRLRLAIPLVGFRQGFSEGVQGEIERQILEEEGVVPEDFRAAVMPEVSARGELRAALAPLRGFSLKGVSRDRISSTCTVEMGFGLYRGSYATVVLREFMKPRNPIKAGF